MKEERIKYLKKQLKEITVKNYNKTEKDFNLDQIEDYGTECFNDGLIKGISQQIKNELKYLERETNE